MKLLDSEELRPGPTEALCKENKTSWYPWQLHPDLQRQWVLSDNCLYFTSSLNKLILALHSSFHIVIHFFVWQPLKCG